MSNNLHIYSTPLEAATALAQYLLSQSGVFIKEQNTVSIALSGGMTPTILYKLLSNEYKLKFQWEKIHLYWVDERCVPPSHSESNYGNMLGVMLKYIAIPEKNVHYIQGDNFFENEVLRYSTELNETLPLSNGIPIIDIVLLGMGNDGHTASLFPNQMENLNSERIVIHSINPANNQKRITLTAKIINQAKNILFFVTGSNKSELLSTIILHKTGYQLFPASFIHPSLGLVQWYLDKQAAQML